MAMKPAGKAILIGVVTIGIAVGVYQSGVLTPKPKEVVEAPVQQGNPVPQSVESVKAAADEAARAATASPQPAAAPAQPDAFDALIRQSGKK